MLRAIKRFVEEAGSTRHPVTDQTLLLIFKALDLSKKITPCFGRLVTCRYFCFLCSSVFTVPNLGSFSPEIHLSLADIGIYSCDAPTCFRVSLKASKTEFFRKGCLIHLGKGNPPLYAIRLLMVYLRIKGNGAGPIFLFQDGKTFVPLRAYRLTMQDSEGGWCPRIFIKRQPLTS